MPRTSARLEAQVARVEAGQSGRGIEVGIGADELGEACPHGRHGMHGVTPPQLAASDNVGGGAQDVVVERVPHHSAIEQRELASRPPGIAGAAQTVEQELLPTLDAEVEAS